MTRFGRIPEDVLAHPRLSMTAKVVYAALALHRNTRTGQCNPTHAVLGGSLRLCRRALINALRALEKEGEIVRHYEPGRRISYHLARLADDAVDPWAGGRSTDAGTCTPTDASACTGAGASACTSPGHPDAPPRAPACTPSYIMTEQTKEQTCEQTARAGAREEGHTPTQVAREEADQEPSQENDRVRYSVDPEPGFTPDPGFSANALLTHWRDAGLPLPRSVHWTVHEQALAALHQQPPHWPAAQVRQAIDKLVADHRGPRVLSWAWKGGPAFLARQRPGEPQGIEKVLAWEPLRRPAADAVAERPPDAIDALVARGLERRRRLEEAAA
jgi:hypothetical protein